MLVKKELVYDKEILKASEMQIYSEVLYDAILNAL